MMKIVVGIDFSDEAMVALEQAMAVARHNGGEITLVHVSGGDGGDVESASVRELIDEHRNEVRGQLADLRERYSGQGVEISHSMIDGYADAGLCKAAAELGADLVIVGTHGRTGLRRFFLGSVAEKVVRMCECDILVARSGRATGGYQRILVPTDFSDAANHALEKACQLAAPEAEIDLVHYWQLPMPITHHQAPLSPHKDVLRRLAANLNAEAAERAKPLLEKHRREGLAIEFDSHGGSPSHAVVGRAPGYDLIAMGSHGHRGFKRFVLGSVAEQTVRHAPCSVFITHAQAVNK